MKFLNIVKDGIPNVVDEAMYKAVYKPVGWKIVSEELAREEIKTSPADELVQKNTTRMKRVTPEAFDDKLIKDKGNGKL